MLSTLTCDLHSTEGAAVGQDAAFPCYGSSEPMGQTLV